VSLLAMLSLPFGLNAAFDKGGVLGVGARATGMGDAFTAIADDSTSAFWNPAGMIQIPSMELSTFFGPLLNGKEYYMAGAFAMPFLEQTAMALSIVTLAHNTGEPDRDSSESTYILTFATPLNVERTVSFGVNLKFLQYSSGPADSATLPDGTIIHAQASAMGIDLGFLYQIPLPSYGKRVSLGFFAQDLDTVLRWESGVEERVPLLLAIGGAYWIEDNLVLDVDYSFFNDPNISGVPLETPVYDAGGNQINSLQPDQSRPHVGIEGWFFDGHLGLRTGFVGFATTADRFTAGVSYKQPLYGVDYAYMGHAEHLGDSHRLSAHYNFGSSNDRTRVVSLVNPPTDLSARPSNNSVNLSWTPNPDPHVTGYTIYMGKAAGAGYIPIQKRVKDTKVKIDGLTNGTRFYFVVTSVNDSFPAVESNYSNEVSAIPGPQLPTAPVMGAAAQAEQGPALNGVAMQGGWPVPTGNIAGYNLYMSPTPGSGYKKVNSALITTSSYKVSNMEPNKLYYFVLTQVTNDNPPTESRPSQEFSKVAVLDSELPAANQGPAPGGKP
jgi:hypothetical protein